MVCAHYGKVFYLGTSLDAYNLQIAILPGPCWTISEAKERRKNTAILHEACHVVAKRYPKPEGANQQRLPCCKEGLANRRSNRDVLPVAFTSHDSDGNL